MLSGHSAIGEGPPPTRYGFASVSFCLILMFGLLPTSPILRCVVRHTLTIWVGVRVLVMFALVFAPRPAFVAGIRPESISELATGMAATATAGVVTLLLATSDRYRIGAPVLLANMGYSLLQRTAMAAAIVGAAELVLRAAITLGNGIAA